MNKQRLISLATAMVLMLGLVACTTTIPEGQYALADHLAETALWELASSPMSALIYLGREFSVKGNRIIGESGI